MQDGVSGGGQAGVVGDEDDRVAGRESADHREQALRAGLVQASGRLVQDQHRGVPQEGPGQADSLALAAGQQAASRRPRWPTGVS